MNISKLILQISNSGLYASFVQQIIKDFELIGQSVTFNESINPKDLIIELQREIHFLLTNNFDTYLQLLYRVDIPEKLMNFTNENSEYIARKATLYIVQREWQKVKFREKFDG